MKKMVSATVKKIKDISTALLLPYGIDQEYDKDCDSSFSRALDFIYYALSTAFAIYAIFVFYFFFKHTLDS